MIRLASALPLFGLLLAGACATVDAPRSLSAATAAAGQDSTLRRTCEDQAERVVLFRERGQSARFDDDISLTDANNTFPSLRQQSDAFNRRTLREDLVRECIRNAGAGPAPQDRTAPAATRRRGN